MHVEKTPSKLVNFCAVSLILKMEEDTQHFWHIMLYYFKKGKNSIKMQEKNSEVYREVAATYQTCQKGFAKFLDTIDILTK